MSSKQVKKIRKILEPKPPIYFIKKRLNLANSTLIENGDALKVLQPMHLLLSLLAPVPYRIKKVNGVLQAIATKHNVQYYILYTILCIVMMTGGMLHQNQNVIEYAQTQINAIATNIILISFYMRKTKIIKSLNKIVKLEKQFKKIGFTIQSNLYNRLVWVFLPIHVLLVLAMRRLDFLEFSATENLAYITNIFTALVRAFYFYYIVACVLLTNDMLRNLNAFLIETYETDATEVRISRMRTGRILYSKIWHITRCLNLNYNIPIIVICGTSFMNSTSTLYDWWKNNSSYTTSETIQWTIIHVAKLVILSLVCDNAKQEGDKVAEMLHKLYEKSADESKHEKSTIYQFLVQVMHEKIEYWACEMFPINKNFICLVVVAGTTYSILLVQLGDKTSPSNVLV